MTNTITLRPRRSKAEIRAKAGPNVSAWINQLIEREFATKPDWGDILKRKRPKVSSTVYQQCMQAE